MSFDVVSNDAEFVRLSGVGVRNQKVRLYVREWRKFRRITLAELGKKLGKEKITISRWERNVYPVTVDQLYLIAEVLNCSLIDLLTRKPDPNC